MYEMGEGSGVDKRKAYELYKKAKAGISIEDDGTDRTRMLS